MNFAMTAERRRDVREISVERKKNKKFENTGTCTTRIFIRLTNHRFDFFIFYSLE